MFLISKFSQKYEKYDKNHVYAATYFDSF